MNIVYKLKIAIVVLACLTGAEALADDPVQNARPPKILRYSPPAIPAPESLDTVVASTVSPQATALSPPVTLTYSGSSNAITVTDSGTGRGISSTVTNTNSGSSAVVGSTVGTGAGLTGLNSGSSGPGGKFEVTNANSDQAGAFATTNGTGPAILATVTNTNNTSSAILGENLGASGSDTGVGVTGQGGDKGVTGIGNYVGVYGQSTSGSGVTGLSTYGAGGYFQSISSYAVYGYSSNSYAGYFDGSVAADSYATLSDKNAKANFASIDNSKILDKISRLPITSWDFKTDKKQRRHVGPMAQDFHAQFGLGGDDDKHINLGDMAGVTLAAVQELNQQMKAKDAEIAELKAQLASQSAATAAQSARVSLIEQQLSQMHTVVASR